MLTEEQAAEQLKLKAEQLAVAAATLSNLLTSPATKAKLYDSPGSPTTLVRYFAGGRSRTYFCVLEMDGLDPYRTTTAEERQRGFLSLQPVAVHARTAIELVEVGSLALQTAIHATPGYSWGEDKALGAGDLAMIHYRTARAIRHTLRLIGEDV